MLDKNRYGDRSGQRAVPPPANDSGSLMTMGAKNKFARQKKLKYQ